jgi:hypothetical protein
MRTSIVTAAALAATLAAAPLHAQRAGAEPFIQVTPYAGYMYFGNMFEGPLGTSLSSANGAIYGAQLNVKLGGPFALVGNVARASGDMEAGIPFLGGVDVGSSEAWLFDGGIQLTMPGLAGGLLPLRPFVQAGAGAIRYDVASGPVTVNTTGFAGNVGLGADLALSRNFGVRVMAKDYIGRFDAQEATSLPVKGEVSHNFALSAGVTLAF